MDQTKKTAANSTLLTVFSVTGITVVGRVLTLLSLQMYMARYGARDSYLNIYSFALTMPNTVFTCIGTLLTTAVVPIYASLVSKKSEEEAKKFLDDIISISSVLILALIGIGLVIAPILAGFAVADAEELLGYAVFSIRTLMPVMLAYGLSFIFQGILQSHGKFKLVAAVSIPSALSVILYLIIWGDRFGVTGLLFATLIGLTLQAVILLPAVLKTGYRYRPSFDFRNEHMKTCARLVLPVLLGVSAYQVNTLYNTTLATRLGYTTIVQNVQNIVVVSVLTFVYSIAAVYFPRFAVLWDAKNVNAFKKSLSDVMNVLIFLLLPMTFGFIAIRFSLFHLISNYGRITAEDITVSGNLLALYSIGVWALGFKEIFDRAFYAQKNAKISGIVGICIMVLNIALSLILIPHLGVYSLPLSFSLSASAGAAILVFIMRRKLKFFSGKTTELTVKCLMASVVMLIFLNYFSPFFETLFGDSIPERAIKLFVPIIAGVATYFGITWLLGVEQAKVLFGMFLRRSGLVNGGGRKGSGE